MKVILLQEVKGIGKRYEVKEVSDGHAMNFLFPRRLAEPATPERLSKVAHMHELSAAEKKIQEDLLHKNLDTLSGKQIVIKAKASDQGHLFASIHQDDILKALKAQLHVDLAPELIRVERPLKITGEHILSAEGLGRKVSFTVSIENK